MESTANMANTAMARSMDMGMDMDMGKTNNIELDKNSYKVFKNILY